MTSGSLTAAAPELCGRRERLYFIPSAMTGHFNQQGPHTRNFRHCLSSMPIITRTSTESPSNERRMSVGAVHSQMRASAPRFNMTAHAAAATPPRRRDPVPHPTQVPSAHPPTPRTAPLRPTQPTPPQRERARHQVLRHTEPLETQSAALEARHDSLPLAPRPPYHDPLVLTHPFDRLPPETTKETELSDHRQ